jgi:hypothetical protein
MITRIFAAMLMLLLLSVYVSAAGTDGREKAAADEAQRWLAMVDKGEYGASWDGAAGYFKNVVPRAQWEQSLRAVRTPLGKLNSRTVKSMQFMTSLPGAPDGEYVVVQFNSSFHNKKSAVETVTPIREKNGKWRVSGYYIK